MSAPVNHAMTLRGQVRRIGEVSPVRRGEMLALMRRHYENVRPDDFEADLAEKDWVIEVEDAAGRLAGFSTQRQLSAEVAGRTVRALFSGDTIIDPRYWHANPLAGLWGRLVLDLLDAAPDESLDWFLISKGYKTYRFLPVFFREFYPRYDAPTPPCVTERLDTFGYTKFPTRYDVAAGVVRADGASCRLRPGVADIPPARLRDPHVRFFAERNPRHATGDELCCLAPLSRANFTRAAWRVIGSTSSE